MDDQVCPKCKTTRYRNPSMKLMVNDCGHNLCDSCVELLFVKGSGSCPECQIPLRKVNFRVQLFDDALVDREVDIRRRILRDYNKKRDDFDSLRSYNDYLESIEDIIFNLCNDIDILDTNKRINDYKEKNRDSIVRNRHKLSQESMEIQDILHFEEQHSVSKKKEIQEHEASTKLEKQRVKEQMIQELMFSETDANDIVDSFNSAKSKFSTGIDIKSRTINSSGPLLLPELVPDEPYVYSEPDIVFDGPSPPRSDKEIKDFCRHIRAAGVSELAAGYVESIACFRALQEAMSGLYYSPCE
ncbi:CDK-activating kinase assembly factor MAT1 [Lepeophtheirus salmonis]|uniref:CDK-activating kinase assembly factor MAT1 n=1 Tax=Lepeophtheirus salmonis TaxID=72036 RepID=UPI001AE73E98|nr:CDK-activating kinase assembly factor MAT1-like [Lepeophtheirus salmonis]